MVRRGSDGTPDAEHQMETLFSLLGLYQLLAVALPGAVAAGGTYYAVAGLPSDLSAAAVLGLVVLFYIVGNVIQGVAVVWEAPYWQRSGGWPSSRRMTRSDSKAYDDAFRQLIQSKLDKVAGTDTAAMSIDERFGLARAELRRQGQDTRAESFNATYGLSRGLVTAAAVVVVVMLVCAIVGHEVHRNLIAAAIVAASAVPLFHRFRRFGFYFADQVWRDFAALA
jgi:hypothetical protein